VRQDYSASPFHHRRLPFLRRVTPPPPPPPGERELNCFWLIKALNYHSVISKPGASYSAGLETTIEKPRQDVAPFSTQSEIVCGFEMPHLVVAPLLQTRDDDRSRSRIRARDDRSRSRARNGRSRSRARNDRSRSRARNDRSRSRARNDRSRGRTANRSRSRARYRSRTANRSRTRSRARDRTRSRAAWAEVPSVSAVSVSG
jgi:hypothetical protein